MSQNNSHTIVILILKKTIRISTFFDYVGHIVLYKPDKLGKPYTYRHVAFSSVNKEIIRHVLIIIRRFVLHSHRNCSCYRRNLFFLSVMVLLILLMILICKVKELGCKKGASPQWRSIHVFCASRCPGQQSANTSPFTTTNMSPTATWCLLTFMP